jgi:hypothetical protein
MSIAATMAANKRGTMARRRRLEVLADMRCLLLTPAR